jgi:peroxin-11B
MEKIIAFSNKTEARDKFTKAIQYSAKILAWSLLNVDKSYYKRFNDLYLMARDSRKIFRLFKSVQEIKTINDKMKDLLWKSEKFPTLCEICSRIGFLIYWVSDNFFILSSVKMLNVGDMYNFSYIAHLGWLIGILWALVKNLYELIILLTNKESEKPEREGEGGNINSQNIRKREILMNLIGIIGKLGDLLPASSGVNIPERFLGYHLSDGVIGIGGLISAIVAMWGLWNQF